MALSTGAQDRVMKVVPVIDEANLRRTIKDVNAMESISPTMKSLLSASPLLLENVSSKELLKNATFKITDDDKCLEVKAGDGNNKFTVHYDDDGVPDIVELSQRYINDTEYVPEINKRLLAKAILQYCGNEGVNDNATKSTLRRLFQLGIDQIHQIPDPSIWRNATVVVYDDQNNSYTFVSGTGKHRFVANECDGKPNIVYIVDNKKQKAIMNGNFTEDCSIL